MKPNLPAQTHSDIPMPIVDQALARSFRRDYGEPDAARVQRLVRGAAAP